VEPDTQRVGLSTPAPFGGGVPGSEVVASPGQSDNTIRTNLMHELASVLCTEREAWMAAMREQREDTKTEQVQMRNAFEAAVEAQKLRVAEMQQRLTPTAACDAISDSQLLAVQARLQSLSEAQLLSDEERYSVEDLLADCMEVIGSATVQDRAVEKVVRLVAVSERMVDDAAFARQLRRKFS
jgi:hypothetical protein